MKKSLLNSYKSKFFLHGETLFREGNTFQGLMFIYSGKVKIFKSGINGEEVILRVAHEGDFIGYNKLFTDSQYKTSAEAIEDTITVLIPKKEFLSILQ